MPDVGPRAFARYRKGPAIALADVVSDGDPLPSAFRIFSAGVNESTQGPLIFDEKSAELVMAQYVEHGVDVCIDLQHDSVDAAARAMRDDAADARGYCKLAVRDGELWAVDVTWSPDGERRLRERRQRYISPVAIYDEKTLRVTELFNLALVSMPASHNAVPLVASRRLQDDIMDPSMVKAAMDALIAGDGDKALALLKEAIAAAAAGDEAAAPSDDATAEAADEAPDEEADEEDKDKDAALSKALARLLKVDSQRDILANVKSLQRDVNALKMAKEADEHLERVDLVGRLVKLGVEIPATAWDDADAQRPADHLRRMSLSKLRDRVAAFEADPQRGGAVRARPATAFVLSEDDRAIAESITDEHARKRFVAIRERRASK